MGREAIILAGGLGTRLKGVIDDLPKSMAPVGGKPFLVYILDQLCRYRFTKVILAVGHKHEEIISFFGNSYKEMELEFSIEDEPLGTGGALLKASALISARYYFVFNGDTFFNTDISGFENFFIKSKCDLAVALKSMKNFERYGSVIMEGERIKSFNEKKFCNEGLINGGVYIINGNWLRKNSPGTVFSFERDILEKRVGVDHISGYISDRYFIDIGVPEDYDRANRDLPLKIT